MIFQRRYPQTSCVIASFNGERTIKQAVESVMAQGIWVECIVVIDGSRDNSAEICASLPCICIVLPENLGISKARNVGINAANSEWVTFLDDDCVLPADWFENLQRTMDEVDQSVIGIGGHVEPYEVRTLAQFLALVRKPLAPLPIKADSKLISRMKAYVFRYDFSWMQVSQAVSSLVGASMTLRRKRLIEIGGFEPSIRFGGDETNLASRIRQAFGPHALYYSPHIKVLHKFDPRVWDPLRRSYLYGYATGRDFAQGKGSFSPQPGAAVSTCLGLVLALSLGNFAALSSTLVFFALLQLGLQKVATGGRLRFRVMVYPLLFLEEISNNIGFLVGNLAHRKVVR